MILLGDTHLGIKRFNLDILETQLDFLKSVVLLAKETKREIFQFGDIFDNRVLCDICFLNKVIEFFQFTQDNKVIFKSLLGNHDIYYRERLDINLPSVIQKIFPGTFILYDKNTIIEYKDKKILVIPWITKNSEFPQEMVENVDAIFGHLEINGFEMVKGHYAQNSNLNESNFKIPVYSGHFHIKSDTKNIHYIGTPYQINWNDFDEEKGIYMLNEDLSVEFIENTQSPRFIKLIFNSNSKTPLEILGFKEPITTNLDNFRQNKELLKILRKSNIKFIITTNDTSYEDFLFILRENCIKFDIINQYKINEIVTQEIQKDTKDIILSFLKDNHEHYIPEIIELIGELDD